MRRNNKLFALKSELKMSTKMKVSLMLFVKILFLSLLFSFNSCSEKQSTLKIGYIPIAECVQLYVAQERGYFEELGLEVELISLAGGAKILNALNSGSVDVGFSNVVSLVIHRARGADFFSIFGGTYEDIKHQNHALVVNKNISNDNIGITLRGARIAVNTYKNIEELMVRKYVEDIGLAWEDINRVETPFPRMLPLIESGEINAASIVEPFITIAKEDTTNSFSILANHYLTTTPQSLVATYVSSEEFVTNNPEKTLNFRSAMDKATTFIEENELEAREIIGLYTKIPEGLLTRVGLSKFSSTVDEDLLQQTIDDMVKYSYLENLRVPSVSELIYEK